MAGELGVPVLLLLQLRRTGGGKPKLEDLRESGALEQDADLAVFLHRKKHTDGGLTEVMIEKNRNGATGSVYLDFKREIVRFDPYTGSAEAIAEADAADQAAEKKDRAIKHARRAKRVVV
jgi:replicative DNA helicase